MDTPNILFLFSDQHRGDWLPFEDSQFKEMGMKPLDLDMKNLRTLMKNGVTFTNAVTNSPLCVPARACLATGLQYYNCGVKNNDFCLPIEKQNFYKVLKAGGYQVGGVGKFDLHKPILYWGKNGWIKQLGQLGFTDAIDSEGKYDLLWSSFYESKGPYADFLRKNNLFDIHARDYIQRYFDACDSKNTSLPEFAYADNWVTNNAENMLGTFCDKKAPWFLMVNFSGPHNPWDITQSMKERCKNKKFSKPEGYTGNLTRINEVRQNYSAMLENIDNNIGKILSKLKEKGQYEKTIIIYASDHGEMLGDHNRFFKSVPYRGAIKIPMIISGPRIVKDKICTCNVQLHDLAATILDFAGMKFKESTDSISVKPLVEGNTAQEIRDYQIVMLNNSEKHNGSYSDYQEYEYHKKRCTDSDYINEFNKKYHLPIKDSVKRFDYYKDWGSIIKDGFKLVLFSDGKCELYSLEKDPFELQNVAQNNPEIVNTLKNEYIKITKKNICKF